MVGGVARCVAPAIGREEVTAPKRSQKAMQEACQIDGLAENLAGSDC